MCTITCKVVERSNAECVWRRLQVHEVQADREHKNILQKVLIFTSRAKEMAFEDWSVRFILFLLSSEIGS